MTTNVTTFGTTYYPTLPQVTLLSPGEIKAGLLYKRVPRSKAGRPLQEAQGTRGH